jgi:hypothetical protein
MFDPGLGAVVSLLVLGPSFAEYWERVLGINPFQVNPTILQVISFCITNIVIISIPLGLIGWSRNHYQVNALGMFHH